MPATTHLHPVASQWCYLLSGTTLDKSPRSHNGLEWDDASTLRLSTSAAAGRAVFMYKYQELA